MGIQDNLDTNSSTDPSSSGDGEARKKKRGRPPGSHKKGPRNLSNGTERVATGELNHGPILPLIRDEAAEEQLAYEFTDAHLSPFSRTLRNLVHRDRAEIMRVARELEVSENTIYRWMNGSSDPRAAHLRALLGAFPGHRETLLQAINRTFGDLPDTPTHNLSEVRKEIYLNLLEILTASSDSEQRFRQISQALFAQILVHLDPAGPTQRGLAVTFARAMQPRPDGIHSLREVVMSGTGPWASSILIPGYLGSTTLAGMAVELQRMQLWDDLHPDNRAQVEVDENEHSACVYPIMRGNFTSGALIISSTQPDFFHDTQIYQILREYALLIQLALPDNAFYPSHLMSLRPMPPLKQQREKLSRGYRDSILTCARVHGLSRREAESQVEQEYEAIFEAQAREEHSQTREQVNTYTI